MQNLYIVQQRMSSDHFGGGIIEITPDETAALQRASLSDEYEVQVWLWAEGVTGYAYAYHTTLTSAEAAARLQHAKAI